MRRMKTTKKIFSLFWLFTALCLNNAVALDYTDLSSILSDTFHDFTGSNEGTSSFRSLLIPMGGRSESMGGAFTGLSDDVSFIDHNPAASSIMKESELAVFHNAWIADSNVETIAGTTRFGRVGIGGKLSCFYIPFTEYDSFGNRTAGSYYSETTAAINTSCNFFPGYTFKGLALGFNAKVSWRSVPDYADNDTNDIISGSGLEQSAIAIMGDIGMMVQFNFMKFYSSRDTNCRIGLSLMNVGAALTGFGKSVQIDDPLPTIASFGLSYKLLDATTFSAEFQQPINLFDIGERQLFSASLGAEIKITNFFSALAGFKLKGGNPRFSIGGEFDLFNLRVNANYTLDLSSSLNPANHFSLSAKLKLGDNGRAKKRAEVDRLYFMGVEEYAKRNYDKAILHWQQTLKLDKFFDPAKQGIKNARKYQAMLKRMEQI